MNIPVYNCIIDENLNDETGIYAISFVDLPANETDFIALSKEDLYLNKDSKKQILTGVVLKPEQMIYRKSPEIGDYYIKFSAEQIEKIACKMMKTGLALHNTTHQHQSQLSGNYLTELWIVENPQNDKGNALGFNNLPKGTLMCSYKIEDSDYWNSEVMSGNVKGFSLEGFFNQEICMSRLYNNKIRNMNKRFKKGSLLSKIGRFFLDIETVESDDTTNSGEAYIIFVLADGKEVYVDTDGYATLDEEQCPAGEHKLADGNILVIDEQGQFVETKEAATAITDPEEATAAQTLSKQKSFKGKTKQKLEDSNNVSDASIDELKQKIAELQNKLAEAEAALQVAKDEASETKSEIEQLKKNTPSAQPAAQKQTQKLMSDMSYTERMSATLQQKITLKK